MSWCTKKRSAAVQTWPQLRFEANNAPRTATSSGAEGITMKGSFPEASIRCGLKVLAQAWATIWPVSTPPVKATMWVSGLSTSALPTGPVPLTHCTTPGGSASKASMNLSVVSVVSSEGLTITELPAASAAAASQQNSTSGKLKGRMMTTTPMGSLTV